MKGTSASLTAPPLLVTLKLDRLQHHQRLMSARRIKPESRNKAADCARTSAGVC